MSKTLNNSTIQAIWLLTRAAKKLKNKDIELIDINFFTRVCCVDGLDEEGYEIKIAKI